MAACSFVARDMVGVNGVAYDGAAHKLYVSNSVTQQVTSFGVAADGSLSTAKLEWTAAGFPQLDGMVVDELGRAYAYVAGYGQGEVFRVSDGAVIAKVENPASLAFHGGDLLVVDYHLNEPTKEGGSYAVQLGVLRRALIALAPFSSTRLPRCESNSGAQACRLVPRVDSTSPARRRRSCASAFSR